MDSSYGEAEVKAPETPETPESIDEENASDSEILIAKARLPEGSKKGDIVTFRIANDFGDESSLELVKSSKSPTSDTMNDMASEEIMALDKE